MKWKIQFRENGSLYQTLFRDISGLPLLPGHECHCNRIMNHIRTMGLAAGGAAGGLTVLVLVDFGKDYGF